MQNSFMAAKAAFHCPRWAELPGIPLYLDQLVMVVQSSIGLFFEDGEQPVTKTMVNNYVKQRMVEAPEQKKYSRGQIAQIIVISLLKRVFSMSEIHRLVESNVKAYGNENAYDMFCTRLEVQLSHAFDTEAGPFVVALQNEEPDAIMDTAIAALVCKLRVQHHLAGPPAKTVGNVAKVKAAQKAQAKALEKVLEQ